MQMTKETEARLNDLLGLTFACNAESDNIAYNIGTLAKFAILNTDEGFEDSAIVSDSLSEAMASDVVFKFSRPRRSASFTHSSE